MPARGLAYRGVGSSNNPTAHPTIRIMLTIASKIHDHGGPISIFSGIRFQVDRSQRQTLTHSIITLPERSGV